MTRDEIIRMAREAGIKHNRYPATEELERFATAAYEKGAAAESEECAKLAEGHLCGFCVSDLAATIRARGTK